MYLFNLAVLVTGVVVLAYADNAKMRQLGYLVLGIGAVFLLVGAVFAGCGA